MTEGLPMTLLTGLTALRHLLGEEEHLDHLDDDTGAYCDLDRNNLTIAIFHGGLIDDHDGLATGYPRVLPMWPSSTRAPPQQRGTPWPQTRTAQILKAPQL